MLIDYSILPSPAADGDVFSLNEIVFTYDDSQDVWVAAGIETFDATMHVYHYRDTSAGMGGTRVLAYTI